MADAPPPHPSRQQIIAPPPFRDVEVSSNITLEKMSNGGEAKRKSTKTAKKGGSDSKKKSSSGSKRSSGPRLPLDSRIAISGLGISGLSAAIALRNAGFSDLVIYERDDAFEEVGGGNDAGGDAETSGGYGGYGLTLTYNPRGPLAELGVLEDVCRADCPSRSHYVFDEKGRVRGYYGNMLRDGENSGGKGRGQRGNLRVPRQVLRRIMMGEMLRPRPELGEDGAKRVGVEIRQGKRVVSYEERSVGETAGEKRIHPVSVRFDDGTTDECDLLIGADGIRSAVARTMLSRPRGRGPPAPSPPLCSKPVPSLSSSSPDVQSAPAAAAVPTREDDPTLSYLGVFLILGLTSPKFFHPLLDERGFHTLNAEGGMRLFTMPYEGSRVEDGERAVRRARGKTALESDGTKGSGELSNKRPRPRLGATNREEACSDSGASSAVSPVKPHRRIMWQLSFRLPLSSDAAALSRAGSESLLDEVRRRVRGWHDPVGDMVDSSEVGSVWGTGLYDRDPELFLHQKKGKASSSSGGGLPSRVVAIGDAVHPMSPFKGQGANQALIDGPLLASWLRRASPDSSLRGFAAQMARRSARAVGASREAARALHFPAEGGTTGGLVVAERRPVDGIAGVRPELVGELLAALVEKGITAALGGGLDNAIRGVVANLGRERLLEPLTSAEIELGVSIKGGGDIGENGAEENISQQKQALLYSASGDTMSLRALSIKTKCPSVFLNAKDNEGKSCLHLAAEGGHYHATRWLLSEALLDKDSLDSNGQRAGDLAREHGHNHVQALLGYLGQELHA